MSRDSKAFTLLEVLIAGSLAAVLFFVLIGLASQVSGVVSKTMVLNELQQIAEMAGRKLVGQVSLCDGGGAAFLDDPAVVALALHPVDDVTASAKKVYGPRVLVYAWQPGQGVIQEVKGTELPPDSRFQPLKLGPAAISSFLIQDHPRRVLCQCVAKMSLTSPDGGFPVLLKLKLQKSAGHYGLQTILVERPLCLRNIY